MDHCLLFVNKSKLVGTVHMYFRLYSICEHGGYGKSTFMAMTHSSLTTNSAGAVYVVNNSEHLL